MKLQTQKFALAASLTTTVAYIACAILVFISPDFSLKFFGWMIHLVNLDQSLIRADITLGGFVIGLIQTLVLTYLFVWLLAWFYNKFLGQK